MKICHKKNFWAGVGMLALGILNLATALWRRDLDASAVVLVVALVLLGGGSLLRGLSPKLAREDKTEERDERNQLIDMKSKSLAFRLTQGISFVLGLLFLVSGAVAKDDAIVALGLGFLFTVTISMFGEMGAFLHYEKKL